MAIISDLDRALQLLRDGGLVAIPTETVYGLAADAENPSAVLRIFAAKGRPSFHPLIVHIPTSGELDRWAARVPLLARDLAERFWPGPLTMILPRSARVPGVVTGDMPTVGLRVPSHPLTLELLARFGGGLAAPSANRFGRVSPTTAEHVREELGERIEMILDGGPCRVGVESTIVDLSGEVPTLLRPGAVTVEQLREVAPNLNVNPGNNATHCSGRLESHYAPQASVTIVSPEQLADEAVSSGDRIALLSTAPPSETLAAGTTWLKMPADASEYARALYSTLREVDRLGIARAFIVLPDEAGLGLAIADRVRKAAAPRQA
jgi:L-threonylcarbamoyladenylate synthase